MMGQQSSDTALMRELGFTPDDLVANRTREMSARQHYRLCIRRRRSIAIGTAITLALVFVASLFIFMGSREDGSVILTLLGIGLALCNAAILGIFARHWLRLSADIRAKTIQATTGHLERVINPVSRRVFNYAIRVDGVEVFVSKEAFAIFEHHQPYTLYCAPHTGTLLAAERVELEK